MTLIDSMVVAVNEGGKEASEGSIPILIPRLTI